MKNNVLLKKAFLLFSLSILILYLFASCTGKQIPDDSSPSENNYIFSEPYPDSDYLAKEVFNSALALYADFYGLSDVATEWGNENDSFSKEIDGFTVYYNRVIDKRYPTYQAFVDELYNHFSSEIVEELLSKGDYIEKNGKFYSSAGERGINISFHDVKYEIVSQTIEKIIFKATARYYSDIEAFFNNPTPQTKEEWEKVEFETKDIFYTYEKVNNKWVFTTFELFY